MCSIIHPECKIKEVAITGMAVKSSFCWISYKQRVPVLLAIAVDVKTFNLFATSHNNYHIWISMHALHMQQHCALGHKIGGHRSSMACTTVLIVPGTIQYQSDLLHM